MMENEELIEKRNRKKKKYKSMKVWLGILIALCVVLLAACAFAGFSLFKMNDRIEDLTTEISKTKADLLEIQQTSSEISANYEILISEKSTLEADKASLEAENSRLNLELITLQESLSGSSSDIEELEKQIDEKNKSISSLESKIKTLNSNISKLESQIKDLKSQLASNEPEDDPKTEEPKEEVKEPTVTGKVAYLTFDDGISSYTNSILDTLKKYDVKATFFVNWKPWVSGAEEIYKRIINEGHTLANHTATHDFDKVYSTIEGFENEVMTLHNNIKNLTGYEMTLFRFPGGSNASYTKKLGTQLHSKIHELGYEYYDWNIDSGDTNPKIDPDGNGHNVPVDILVKNVLNGATSNTAVILMHDLGSYKKTTIEALPQIIEGLRNKGYTLKAMDESVTPKQFTKDPNQ